MTTSGRASSRASSMSWLVEVTIFAALALIAITLWQTLQSNLAASNITTGFAFLGRVAGFEIGELPAPYTATDSYLSAIGIGLINTLQVAAFCIVTSSILGVGVGVVRATQTGPASWLATGFIELIRNVPLLLQLFVWYGVFIFMLPLIGEAIEARGLFYLSNRGLVVPGPEYGLVALAAVGAAMGAGALSFGIVETLLKPLRKHRVLVAALVGSLCAAIVIAALGGVSSPRMGAFNVEGGFVLSTEFLTLAVGLSLYATAYIAEIVRGGIASVSQGQAEAARALGLTPAQTMRRVILPQVLRVIIPPVGGWHLNTLKNTSLAVAIGYPDLVSVVDTIISQTGQAIEGVALMLVVFLSLSLALSGFLNWYNARMSWTHATSALARPPRAAPAPAITVANRIQRLFHGSRWRSLVNATLIVVALVLAWRFIQWGVAEAVFAGEAEQCRRAQGACWLLVRENHRLILFGAYPAELQWRPLGVVMLYAAGMALSFARTLWNWRLAAVWGAIVGGSFALMSGEMFGLVPVGVDRWGGLPVTLLLASTAVGVAFPLAVLIAFARRSKRRVVRALAAGFVDVMRGVPLVALLFVAALMFPLLAPSWLQVDSFVRVQIALVLFTAAYMAEGVRGGLLSVPDGQREAAQALGLSRFHTASRIVLPQALKVSLPSLVSTAISEVKNTTLVLIVGVFDLLQTTRLALLDVEWRPFFAEAYLFTGAIFFVICCAISALGRRVEFSLARGRAATSRMERLYA